MSEKSRVDDGGESERMEDLRDMLEDADEPGAKELMAIQGDEEAFHRRKEKSLTVGEGNNDAVILWE